MKVAHKEIVKRAAIARKALQDEQAKAAQLQTDLDASNAEIVSLASSLSEIEHEAADSGLAVSDMHAAIKG
jgi:hypothetical protein